MAVAIVNSATNRVSAGVSSCTVSFNAGSGTNMVLVVGLRETDGGDISDVQYNSVALTYIGSVGAMEYWRLVNPSQGSAYDLTYTVTTGFANSHYAISTWQGVDQTTPIGTPVTVTSSAAGTRSTGSVTCPSDGAVLGIMRDVYSDADATGTGLIGQTRLVDGINFAHSYITATGSVSWTNSNYANAWEAVGLPINAAALSKVPRSMLLGVG